MRVVLDTVIYLRAAINPYSPYGRLLSESGTSFRLVVSRPILREVVEVLTRPEFRVKFPRLDAALFERIVPMIALAEIADPVESLEVSRDPTDDKFFECALAGRADYIISEDRDILDVGEYRGVKTVTAAQFLEILDAQAR